METIKGWLRKNISCKTEFLIFFLSLFFFLSPIKLQYANSEIIKTILLFTGVLLAIAIWIWTAHRMKKIYIPHSPLLYALFGIFSSVLISTLLSVELLRANILGDIFEARTTFFYIAVMFLALLSSIFFYDPGRVRALFAGTMISFGILAGILMFGSFDILTSLAFLLPPQETTIAIVGLLIFLLTAQDFIFGITKKSWRLVSRICLFALIVGLFITKAGTLWIVLSFSLGILLLIARLFNIGSGKKIIPYIVLSISIFMVIFGTWVNQQHSPGIAPDLGTPISVDLAILNNMSVSEIIFGVGNNEYGLEWNNTRAIDTGKYVFSRFDRGWSFATTLAIESGLFGAISFVLYFIFLFGKTIVAVRGPQNENSEILWKILFVLWFCFFSLLFSYPGSLFIILFFLFTGVLIAFMMYARLIKISIIEWKKFLWHKIVAYSLFLLAFIVIIFGTYYGIGRYSALLALEKADKIIVDDTSGAIELLDSARSGTGIDVYTRVHVSTLFTDLLNQIQAGDMNETEIANRVNNILTIAETAIDYNPADITNWLALADIYIRIVQFGGINYTEHGERLFEGLLKNFPRDFETYSYYLRFLTVSGDTEKTKELLDILEENEILVPEYFLLRAQQALNNGDDSGALNILARGSGLYPANDQIVLLGGSIVLDQGDYETAASIFERANLINPSLDSFFGMARAYVGIGRKDEASQILQELKKIGPVNQSAIDTVMKEIETQ